MQESFRRSDRGAMPLPAPVRAALDMLNQAGYQAYVVGGAVRDYVRGGCPAQDWDVTTSAPPEAVERVFAPFPLYETGRKHGTVTVVLDSVPLEITTYRVDGAYTDHRRPDSVRFTSDLKEDLARRDFTMNAMAYHPRTGLVDPFGGREDLERGLVRCVGRPDRRFQEDALRILRCLRFASVYRMELEAETAAAAFRCRGLLSAVAMERVQAEITRLLCGPGAEDILLKYGRILAVPIPELAPAFGFEQRNPHHDKTVWAHTAAAVSHVPAEPVLRWAALLHDIGKPNCFTEDSQGTGHFYGHGAESVRLARAVLPRLRLDRASQEQILTLIQFHDRPLLPEPRPVRRLAGKLGVDGLRRLLQLQRGDTLAQAPMCRDRLPVLDQTEAVLDELVAQQACFTLRDLALNGRDLLALGLRGRAVGQLLSACLEAVLEERLPNRRPELLAYAKALAGAQALTDAKALTDAEKGAEP